MLDTSAPASPSAPDLTISSDSGASSTDNITNVVTPSITGTAEIGSVVTVYDGATQVGTGVTDGSGNWSISTSTLSAAAHSLTAKATDAAGNTSGASVSLVVTVDTTAPSAPLAIDLATSSDSGTSSTDNLTNVTTPTITGTAEIGSTVTIYSGATQVGTGLADSSGNWSITISALVAGAHTLTAKASDAAGNASGSSSVLTVTIDTVAPSSTITSATLSYDYGVSNTDFITRYDAGPNQVIYANLSAAKSASDVVQISTNNGTSWTNVTNTNSSTQYWLNIGRGVSSSTTIQIRILDAAGNSNTLSKEYVIDNTAPTTTVATAAFSADSGISNSDLITNVAAQTISGTLNAILVAGEIVQVSKDNGATWVSATASEGSDAWSLSGQTLTGSNTLQARVMDVAGNTSTALSRSYIYSTTSTVSITSAALTNDATPVISGTSQTGSTITLTIGGATFTKTITSGTSWSIDTGAESPNSGTLVVDSNGTNTVTATSQDAAGNPTSTTTQSLVIDTTPPTATIASLGLSGNGVSTGDTGLYQNDFIIINNARFSPTITGALSSALSAGETLRISIDGGTNTFAPTQSGLNFSYAPAAVFNNSVIWVQVKDAAGNTNTLTQTITVDSSAPTQTVVAGSIRFSSDTGTSATDLFTNTASQTISGTLSAALPADGRVQVSLNNGSTWTLADTVSGTSWSLSGQTLSGANTLQARVTDIAGNTSTAVSKAYSVRTDAPVITLSEVTGVLSDQIWEAQSSATFRITLPTTGDKAITGDGIEILLNNQAFATPNTVTLSDANITAGYVDVAVLRSNLGADGAKTISAKLSDLSGNTRTVSTNFTLEGNKIGLAEHGSTYIGDGILKISEVTNATTPVTFRLTLPTTGTVIAGEKVELILGGAPLLPALKSKVLVAADITAGYVDFGVSIADLGPDASKTLSVRVLDAASVDRSIGTSTLQFSLEAFASLNLATTTVAGSTLGYRITGTTTSALGEYFIAASGDVNGDFVPDVLLGSITQSKVYVAFGLTSGGTTVTSTNLDSGTGGFLINGVNGKDSALIGDVNGDGLSDIVVMSNNAYYVVFGKTNTAAVSLSDVASGNGGYTINGFVVSTSADVSESIVSDAGDVNGDGIADFIIGAINRDDRGNTYAGSAYVVFGKTDTTAINVSQLHQTTGTGGFWIRGASGVWWTGATVAGIGDINGDGLTDVAVSSASNTIAIVYGKTNTSVVDLGTMTAADGFKVTKPVSTYTGHYVEMHGSGDFNGDGISDMIYREPQNSTAYLIFGSSAPSDLNLANIAAGTSQQGLVLGGASDISSIGDINGDGLSDVWISANGSDSYVIFGKSSTAAVSLTDITAGTGGFKILNAGFTGSNSQATGSDINGDGLMDLIIGAEGLGGTTAANTIGGAHVVFGNLYGAFGRTFVDIMGDASDNALTDSGAAKTIIGGLGNDTFTAAAASVLYGGAGNDNFLIDAAMITALQSAYGSGGNTGQLSRIDGGAGLDTISLNGTGLTLDFTLITQSAMTPKSDGRIQNIEAINLTGTGNNTVKLTAKDVLDLSNFNAIDALNNLGKLQMKVKGDTGDALDLADGSGTTGWTAGSDVTLTDGLVYHVWNSSTTTATIYVDLAMQVL